MTIHFLVWLLAFFIQLGLLGIAMYGVCCYVRCVGYHPAGTCQQRCAHIPTGLLLCSPLNGS